jgi:hypothetical protein
VHHFLPLLLPPLQAVSALGLARLQPFPVQHIAYACGIEVEGLKGWRVVFSGDTRPCKAVGAAHACFILPQHVTDRRRGAGWYISGHSTALQGSDSGPCRAVCAAHACIGLTMVVQQLFAYGVNSQLYQSVLL